MASIASMDEIITSSENNLTALTTILAPQWVSAPLLRGTSSILWSCITTLVACVYTALHLNIPKDTSTWAMLKLKGLWVTIALLAPEIVVYMAISQLFDAWKLKRGLHELLGDDCGIDLEYCFFVVMGGVELSNIHPDESLRADRPYLSVSPEMMLWSAKLERPMRVKRKRIQDKSKADLLQKCLVLFQATWMAVQCIARRVQGLPLAILEVHTMVHVLCAAVMYTFWLKKPKDVREPEQLYPFEMEGVAALFSERTFRTLFNHGGLFVIPKRVDPNNVFAPKIKLPAKNQLEVMRRRGQAERQRPTGFSGDNYINKPGPSGSEDIEATGDSFRWNTSSFAPSGLLQAGEALPCGLANKGPALGLTPQQLAYCKLILEGFDLRPGRRPKNEATWLNSALMEVPESSLDDSNLRFPFKDLLLLDHFPSDRSIRNRQFYIAMMLPAMYGGIHLAVTSFEFPSGIESRLWLYSGLYIAIGLPIWEVMAWLMVIYESTGVTDTLLRCLGCSTAMGLHKSLWKSIRSALGRVFLLLYSLARLYIIVESFISLRHVPIGVYLTPSWLQMIPHI